MAFSNENEGFTIVEVLIVLAVTAALLGISLIGQGGIRQQAQFRDGTEQLLSEIERLKGEMNTTVNASSNIDCTFAAVAGNEAGTNKDCLVFARTITFSQNQTTYEMRTFIADNTQDSSYSNIRTTSNPDLFSTGETSWGIEFREVVNAAGFTQANYNTIVFSRNLRSGELETRVMPASAVNNVDSYANQDYKAPYSFVFESPEGFSMQINVNEQLNTLSKDIL